MNIPVVLGYIFPAVAASRVKYLFVFRLNDCSGLFNAFHYAHFEFLKNRQTITFKT